MIKLVAVDMDGTFLDDSKKYDDERFKRIFEVMQYRDAEFVVASGNQYVQLVQFFEEIKSRITFVSDNGALITRNGKEIFSGTFKRSDVARVAKVLEERTEFQAVLCGKKGAYVLDSVSDQFIESIRFYCPVLEKVADYSEIDDEILKFALACPEEETERLLLELHGEISEIAIPVSSGHGSIDLIQPGLHKGNALQFLIDYLGLAKENVMAFGDGGNDIEMLELAGASFAMANAPEKVKKAAKYTALSNNDAGVLNELEKTFVVSKI
ncbi:cof family hydrolase [Listeria floridensis FSL S10-1187]|uniref:Cof family hydrolase n=1 Tax=Listeria floridensis FSL S10-1187 TaxID=1265817 RepID=A0ABN0RDS2_9LIST|nr:Cof-type HAD-IIB family hydrolase [Listeria floridensis]EUJ30263.1 cof family hydrolase [Listeria floridensis FSL S10-1187]